MLNKGAYALVIPLKVDGVREAVIIGVQTQGGPGDSEVMIYAAYEHPLDDAYIRNARAIMTEHHILDTLKAPVPDVPMSVAALGRRYGRNEPCPCGSGRKNKKCCNVSGPRDATVFGAMFGG